MSKTLDRAFSFRRLVAAATMAPFISTAIGVAQTPATGSSNALTIVVLEGEGGINIVRQKTAVVPLIEVRDRNDQPVAGAVVTFAVRSGRVAFSGSRTLTVTTNAAGRGAATGLTPTGTGAVQIGASASFQGQTAALTIAQTNVATAAQAAAISGGSATGGGTAGGSGAAAGGASGGAGGTGGISATTIGIVGGAAAGGTLNQAQQNEQPRVGQRLTTESGTRAQRFYESAGWRFADIAENGKLRYELTRIP